MNTSNNTDLELSLVDSWAESLARPDLESIIIDSSEVLLDAVLNDGIVKEIPVISHVVSLYKIGHTFRERSLIKKLIVFLNEVRNGTIDEETKARYYTKITTDKRAAQRELEHVMLLLDRIISERRVQYIAKLYLAFHQGKITWDQFCQCSEVIDRLLPGDAECMDNRILDDSTRSDVNNCSILRLQGLGIVVSTMTPGAYDVRGSVIATKPDGKYQLTTFGKTLADIIREE